VHRGPRAWQRISPCQVRGTGCTFTAHPLIPASGCGAQPIARQFDCPRTQPAGGGPLDIEATIARFFTASEFAHDGAVVRDVRHRVARVSPQTYATVLEALAAYDRRAEVAQIQSPAVGRICRRSSSLSISPSGYCTPRNETDVRQIDFTVRPGPVYTDA